MENVFRYLTGLRTYLNTLIETGEAEKLMKSEIDTKTYQSDRWWMLANRCVKSYEVLNDCFVESLNLMGGEISMELVKRDSNGQIKLYEQLFDIINEFRTVFNSFNETEGFSEDQLGSKFKKIKNPDDAGAMIEKEISNNYSLFLLADDLSLKINSVQIIINERFKFIDLKTYFSSARSVQILPVKKQRTPPATLEEIFINDLNKVSIIRSAISDLSITKDCSDRIITGFIDGCKKSHSLPDINTTDLMKVIYNEVGKAFENKSKPRYDKAPYQKSFNATKTYFGYGVK